MRFIPYKVLIPCAVILALTGVSFLAGKESRRVDLWRTWLSDLRMKEDITGALQEVDAYFTFLQSFYSPASFAASSDPIPALRFQVAQTLDLRKEPNLVREARLQYERLVQDYPDYNYGWPHYLLGRLCERQQDYAAAMVHYRRVSRFNQGHLALEANYRAEIMRVRLDDGPVDPLPLYQQVRFNTNEVVADLSSFADAAFREAPHSEFLLALLREAKGQPDLARQHWESYLRAVPNDPSAQFHRDRLNRLFTSRGYPRDGDLLGACYNPHPHGGSEFLIQNGESLIADYYLAPATTDAQVASSRWVVEMRARNLTSAPVQYRLLLNLKEIVSGRISTNPVSLRIPLPVGVLHNLLELQVQSLSPASLYPSQDLAAVQSFRLSPAASGPVQ